MRLFFALRPAQGPGVALAALADRIAPVTGGRPVARANLHLTLLFLGDLDARSAAAAIDAGDVAAAAWNRAVGEAAVGEAAVDEAAVDEAMVDESAVIESALIARGATDAAGDAAIRVPLDTLGRFAGARVAWVGPRAVPEPLAALHEALRGAARASAVPFDARPFAPHVTLLRRARLPPPPDALPTPLMLAADRFELMRSDAGPDGVAYRPVRSWLLGRADARVGARRRRAGGR